MIYTGYNRLENWSFNQLMIREWGTVTELSPDTPPLFIGPLTQDAFVFYSPRTIQPVTDPYLGLKRVYSRLRTFYDNKPDSNYISVFHLFANSPSKILMEGVESVIDLHLGISDHVSSGHISERDHYSQIESDRVKSVGTRFMWAGGSPQI